MKTKFYLPLLFLGLMNTSLLAGSTNNEPDSLKATTDSDKAKKEEPEYRKTSQQGPRLGYTFLTGDMADLFKAPVAMGGYDCNPAFFQFGYQFEARYLANGDFEGLVEVIPTITGMDQARMFPSLTLLNGLRNNKYGFELALGPTIYIKREALGYYDLTGWHLARDYYSNTTAQPAPTMITRADSRGDVRLTSGVVIALGKTFRSGNLSIPVNAYMVPGKSGWRFGISFGFNLRKTK